MRHPHHGGQNARDWRRRVAALGKRRGDHVSTYKFLLDTQAGDIGFEAAARAYDVTEGIGRGTLIGMLCALHLSGFRLFSNAGDARRFRNRARYPAGFARALEAHAGIGNPGVTVESIEGAFSSPPRSKGGIPPSWSQDDLAVRLFQAWNGRSPAEEDRGGAEFGLAAGIAGAVAPHFGGWKELAGDAAQALARADDYLQTVGPFPKLDRLPPEAAARPANCTFACDAGSPFIDMDGHEDIWLHRVVSVCAARLRRDGLDPTAPRLNGSIVTFNNNGLNWLFGNGLRYLRAATVGDIAGDLAVPGPERRRAEQLKAFADAIPPNPLFETDGYNEFRSSVGGKVSSWVSNYWKRLDELHGMHARPPEIVIPEALAEPENAMLFSGQHTDAAGLEALSAQLAERVGRAAGALAALRGEGLPEPEHVADVERVAGYVADLAGQVAMLDNRIGQEIERAGEAGRDAGRLKAVRRELGSGKIEEPPKLNRISGGTDDAFGETERLERAFNAAVRARRDRFRSLAEAAGADGALDPLPAMAELERRALLDRGRNPAEADGQALRRLLHRIAGMSRRLSPAMAGRVRDAMAPVFADGKKANRYFHNRQGAVYRHPFSNSRHEPYRLRMERARETDWLAWLEGCMEELRAALAGGAQENGPALLRDLLSLEGFVFSQRLRGLPETVPGEAARPGSGAGIPEIPALLAAQLEPEEIPRDTALRAFNLFDSAINGLSFRVFRDSFIVRVRFQRQERDELFYAPKDRAWRPPEDYASAKGDIRAGLELPAVRRDETGAVLPLPTAEGLSRDRFPHGSRALLRQMPHDWFVEFDLRVGAPPRLAGLPMEKNRCKGWRPSKSPAFRLAGPPSFKTWLDRALTHEEVKLGDHTLILDRVFEQSVQMEGGEIRLSAEPVRLRAELAVPVIDKRPYPDAAHRLLFDNIVAIDLGEKRVGFAVFSLTDLLDSGVADPVETGTVAVPAFRRLMAAVRRHRGSRQPNQKVGQTYSKTLMQFRENVIGDVCNRIDTLCARFRAFPVLESSVRNFESGGRQLSMIYGSVLRRYTYSGVQAHRAARRQYWHTGDSWEHPYLLVREWSERTKRHSGKPKPLRIFPGVAVNPAGTSQTCHRCGRNALAALRNMPERIGVEAGGRIVLENGTVRLYERPGYSETESKRFRRNKQRPPLNVPLREGNMQRGRVERELRRNMRRAPKSEMSPDTTQARFVCVYEDCGFDGHADENAAVNIGRRFLERIDIERSQAARREA